MPASRRLFFASIYIMLFAACSRPPRLSPFTSDGCSLFPDKDYLSGASWCGCCVEHDYAYWKGGSDADRLAADLANEDCIIKRTGDTTVAHMVFRANRAGGSKHYPTWYRWGYGWPYEMKAIPDSSRQRMIGERGGTDRAAVARGICGEDSAAAPK
jgi:hypothetical protein